VTLTATQVNEKGLADWRLLRKTLHARFRTGDFATGLALVDAIGEAAEAANHHPDLTLTYPRVAVRLTSHDVDGISDRDIDLAREISRIAAAQGIQADPSAVLDFELALDTPDHAAIKPFWRAVLGYADHPSSDDEVNDPAGLLPTLWFQATDAHHEPRQRFHLDVHVPHNVAAGRIAAALAAGGTLVSDDEAPAFVVLADADGNKACICTWQGRE
jgi:4a-hydroxytetrahydrobiopterin dehydratase